MKNHRLEILKSSKERKKGFGNFIIVDEVSENIIDKSVERLQSKKRTFNYILLENGLQREYRTYIDGRLV